MWIFMQLHTFVLGWEYGSKDLFRVSQTQSQMSLHYFDWHKPWEIKLPDSPVLPLYLPLLFPASQCGIWTGSDGLLKSVHSVPAWSQLSWVCWRSCSVVHLLPLVPSRSDKAKIDKLYSSFCSLSSSQTLRKVWIGRNFKHHLVQTPCNEQGHHQIEQVAQSPVKPGLELFQGWDVALF